MKHNHLSQKRPLNFLTRVLCWTCLFVADFSLALPPDGETLTFKNASGATSEVTLTSLFFTTEEVLRAGNPPFEASQIGTYRPASDTSTSAVSTLYFDTLNPVVGSLGRTLSSVTPVPPLLKNDFPKFSSGGHLDAVSLYTQRVGAEPSGSKPVAKDDSATTDSPKPVDIDVLRNDTDSSGSTPGSLTIYSFDATGANLGGTVARNATGGLTYTPAGFAVGKDTFTYRVNDGVAVSDPAVVTVTVSAPANRPPEPRPDAICVEKSVKDVRLDVLRNDEDPDKPYGDDLRVTAANGANAFKVRPAADGSAILLTSTGNRGEYTITYSVSDLRGSEVTGVQVLFTIADVCPVAQSTQRTLVHLASGEDSVSPDFATVLLESATEPTAAGVTLEPTVITSEPVKVDATTDPLPTESTTLRTVTDGSTTGTVTDGSTTVTETTAPSNEETLLILSTHEDSVLDYCLAGVCSVTNPAQMEVNPDDIVVINVTTDSVVKAVEGELVFVNQAGADIDAVYYTVGSSGSATVVFSVDQPAVVSYSVDAVDPRREFVTTVRIDANDLLQCLVLSVDIAAETNRSAFYGLNLADCSIILDPDGTAPDQQLFSLPGIDVNGIHVQEASLGSDALDSRCPEEIPSSGVVNLEWCPIFLTVDTPTDSIVSETRNPAPGVRFTEKNIVRAESGALSVYQDLSDALHGDVGREQLYGFFLPPDSVEFQFLVNRTDDIFKLDTTVGRTDPLHATLFLQSDDVADPHPHDVDINAISIDEPNGKRYFSVDREISVYRPSQGDTVTLKPNEIWTYDPSSVPAFSKLWETAPGVDVDALHIRDLSNPAAPSFLYSVVGDVDGAAVRRVLGAEDTVYLTTQDVFGTNRGDVDALSEILAGEERVHLISARADTFLQNGTTIRDSEIYALTGLDPAGTFSATYLYQYLDPQQQLETQVNDRTGARGGVPYVSGPRNIDGIHVDSGAEPPALDIRFRIEPLNGGTALTCEPDRIRIIAESPETVAGPYVPVTNYTGTIEVSTSSASDATRIVWSLPPEGDPMRPANVGVDGFQAKNGVATYRFLAADQGQVVLDLSFPYEELISINVRNADGSETDLGLDPATAGIDSADPPRNFVKAGLRFYEGRDHLRTQIAGKNSNELPHGGGMFLSVVADDGTGACVAACSGDVAVEFAYDCATPVVDPARDACESGLVTIDDKPISRRSVGYTPTALNFAGADASRAPFEFLYDDAAKLRLWARVTGAQALQSELGLPPLDPSVTGILCEAAENHSNDFVVRPFAFGISDVAAGTGARVMTATNPGGTAADETSAGFVSAGSAFDYVVAAYRWDSADDVSSFAPDGTLLAANVPDGHPDPDADPTTLNNGTNNELALDFKHFDAIQRRVFERTGDLTPSGGVAGSLSPTYAFEPNVPGPAYATVRNETYSEVGSLRIAVSLENYLGGALASGGSPDPHIRGYSPTIGRFYPDRFALTASNISEGATCLIGGPDDPPFVYMGEPDISASFTLQAQNTDGVVTSNYTLGRGYHAGLLAVPTVVAENADSGTDLGSRLDLQAAINARLPVPDESWGGVSPGVLGYKAPDFTTAPVTPGHVFSRDAAPDGPYSQLELGLGLLGKDTAPQTVGGGVMSGLDMRLGEDDCATFSCSAAKLSGSLDVRYGRARPYSAYGTSSQSLEVPVLAEYFDGLKFVQNEADHCTGFETTQFTLTNSGGTMTVPIGDSSTTGTVNNNPLIDGDAGLVFSPPGSGNEGFFDLNLIDLDSWLKYDWGNGVDEDPPSVRIEFGGGKFRGSDRVIYWREQLR